MRYFILISTLFLSACLTGHAQGYITAKSINVSFRFIAQEDVFYLHAGENKANLDSLLTFVKKYQKEIIAGEANVNVEGYCKVSANDEENLKSARKKSNSVKSEIIRQSGLTENNFKTKNYGKKSELESEEESGVVLVYVVLIPIVEYVADKTVNVQEIRPPYVPQVQIDPEEEVAEVKEEEKVEPKIEVVISEDTIKDALIVEVPLSERSFKIQLDQFYVRTNVLYDAFLTPTVGVEWRIDRDFGIKLDGSYANWGGIEGKSHRIWLISPEFRWYFGKNKSFYTGIGGNIGVFNFYKGMIGNMLSGDNKTGYQGHVYNCGVIAGYQYKLTNNLYLDFNLGLGYSRFIYDSFNYINNVRVYNEKGQKNDMWGLTQAGINVVWKFD